MPLCLLPGMKYGCFVWHTYMPWPFITISKDPEQQGPPSIRHEPSKLRVMGTELFLCIRLLCLVYFSVAMQN